MLVQSRPFSLAQYSWYVLMRAYIGAMCDTAASYSTTIAYTLDSSGFVSLFSYTQIPYGFLSDIFLFHQTFKLMQLVCAVFICAVTLAVTYLKLQRNRRLAEEESVLKESLKQS